MSVEKRTVIGLANHINMLIYPLMLSAIRRFASSR